MPNPSTIEMLNEPAAAQTPQRPVGRQKAQVGRPGRRRRSRRRSGRSGRRRLCGSNDAGQDVWSSRARRPNGSCRSTGPTGGARSQRRGWSCRSRRGTRCHLDRRQHRAQVRTGPGVGTVLVAKTTCPAGKILLSGGAQVSAPGVLADRNVELRSSFPFSTTQWQTVAIVTGRLGTGVVMTMRPYVVCGEATPTASSTTPTT